VAKTHRIFLGLGLATLNMTSPKPLENKLVLFNPDGDIVMDYWKAIPVPGGEAAISAVKGKTIPQIQTQYGKLSGAICFDMDFPQHIKQAEKVDIFIAPSNDWKAIDPWHTHMARFRAIEQGFNLIRHTSNGLSAGVDYTGKIISEMDHYMDEETVLITHLPTKGVVTVYSVVGDIFPKLGFLLLIFIVVHSRRKQKPE
jgi:apolipoprotein N-acyltransferase